MKVFGAKHLVSAVVATATVVSAGCIAMADEIDKTVGEAADAVAVVEETAETEEEVQAQEEEAVIVENNDVIAEETEEVVAEVAEVTAAEEAVEVVEDEIVYEVEEEIVSEEADYAITNGWYQDSYGDWYYYKNGKALTGWQQIDGKYYYFYSDGEMCIGKRYDEDYKALFIFGINGAMQTGWVEYDGSWYYCDTKTGKAARGWNKINGSWYYFSDSEYYPTMYRGRCSIGSDTYLFNDDGQMLTGWQESYGDWYYYNRSSGKMFTGWHQIGNEWYYFDSYGEMYSNQVTSIYDKDAKKYFYYAFDENGVMQRSGWYNTGSSYEVYVDGELVYSGYEGSWYYLEKNGQAAVGWKQIGNKWYYFYTEGNPYAKTGLFHDPDNGRYYFFDYETYAMVTNAWRTPSYDYYMNGAPENYQGSWYYFQSDGSAVRSWKQIGNEWYYFGAGNATGDPYMRKGIISISGIYYLLGDNGVMRKGGWCQYYDEYYYADNNGVLYTSGWKTIGGKTYYFESNGCMATGYKYVGNKLRDFGKDGACRNPG